MEDVIDVDATTMFACGHYARELYSLKYKIYNFFIRQKAELVWLPSVRNNWTDYKTHPQQVESNNPNAFLSHAACLPFWDRISDNRNCFYAGFSEVHRLESLVLLDKEFRFTNFSVAEFMFTGNEDFCKTRMKQIRNEITTSFLGFSNGVWKHSKDSFIGFKGKDEYVAKISNAPIALCSSNFHGTHFLEKKGLEGVSGCIGFGIERLYQAMRLSKFKNADS